MPIEIKTFEDACKVQNLDPAKVIPDFSFFHESDRKAMIAHAKLVIINKAIVGDWVPDWSNNNELKYCPWFYMGSASGVGFSFGDFDIWDSNSNVGSRLCFQTREQAIYAGKQFENLYKDYFVKA